MDVMPVVFSPDNEALRVSKLEGCTALRGKVFFCVSIEF